MRIASVLLFIKYNVLFNEHCWHILVVKQRMQVYGTPYRSWLDCSRSIVAREGWRAFYYSFGTQLILNIPYQSLHFVVYEFVQDLINPDRKYAPGSHVLSGAAAGAVAAAVTTPFDVCKTLLNTQESEALAHHGNAVQVMTSFNGTPTTSWTCHTTDIT